MAEEADREVVLPNFVSGMSGFMPGYPLIRKSDGGVAFSEDFGDTIHGRRELFRFILREVLTKPRMESPSRLDLLALDTRHDTDEFNVGAGGYPVGPG